jgi:hypothetical protein
MYRLIFFKREVRVFGRGESFESPMLSMPYESFKASGFII